MPSLLFICTANICRSPLAMGLWRSRVAGEEPPWRVESAGVWALTGQPAAEKTRLVLQARGIDISDHRSQQVTAELLAQFDLALTMEAGQQQALRAAFPRLAGRIHLLGGLVGRSGRAADIPDPVGGSLADFEDTARELESILSRGESRLRLLVAGRGEAGT